uniref:Uncharacterized protein n=1 Tax=Ditylenchus dipsaci TaxID=166011 RepID=A0A915E4U0_9BILA
MPSDDVKTADSPSYAPSPAARNVDETSSDVSAARVRAFHSDDFPSNDVITAKSPVFDASSTKRVWMSNSLPMMSKLVLSVMSSTLFLLYMFIE